MNVTFDGSEWRHAEHTKEIVVEKYLSTEKGRRQNTEDISSTVGWSRSFKVFLCRCMIHFTSVIYLESKTWSATYWVWKCEKRLVVLKLQISASSKVKDGKEGKLLSRLSFSSGQYICEIPGVSLKCSVLDALLWRYVPGPHTVVQAAHTQWRSAPSISALQ